MRHLITLAAVAALAGCSVDVEGAACLDDANCPAGQRCGYGGTCSSAAAACPGPICQQHECSGQTARRCVVSGEGPCSSFEEELCSGYEDCSTATGTCGCKDTPCLPGVNAYCDGSGSRVVCATDPATQCRYVASTAGCGLGETCGGAPDATCQCPLAGANVGDGCGSEGKTSCLGSSLLTCVPRVDGSACLVWSPVEDCAGASLVCDPGTAGPPEVAAACLCPPHLESPVVLHADRSAATRPGLARNGALEPSSCRYLSLSAAVAAASSGNTVKAIGYGGTPVVFTEGPFTIPAGVSVVTDDATPTPANYVVEVGGAGVQGVRLESEASMAGVTLRRGTDGPALGARVVGTSPTGRASLLRVRVDALGAGLAFATGVRVEGTGTAISDAVTLEDIGIQGASGTGFEVAMDAVEDTVAAASVLIESNNVGIKLSKGHLTLTHPTVKASAAEGINADIPALNNAKLTVQDGLIQRNGTVGLWWGRLAGLTMERTRVCGNAGSSRTLSGETRTVGGILALGAAPSAPSLVFSGNSIHDNGGDQVFIGAGTGWNLSSPSCTPGVRNLVVGYVDAGSVGVSEIGAVVVVRNWEWATASTPEPGVDFYASPQGGSVDAIGTGGDFCLPPIPAQPPVCPP